MSGGYTYGENQPTETCPYCKRRCDADFVDVGVGYVQCGPYHCDSCGASEIGSFDKSRELTNVEKETGWYAPDSEPGSSANVVDGKIVSYRVMTDTYKDKFTNNMDWHDKALVDDWWTDIRAK